MYSTAAFILTACIAPALAETSWQTDLDAALTQAAAEHKAVLAAFTGKGWCGSCMDLERKLTHTPAFMKEAAKNFILVELDLPQNAADTEPLKKRNSQWAARYGISYVPALLVLDAEGGAYGGYFGGTHTDEIVRRQLGKALSSLKERAEKRRQADQLDGNNKTETLLQAYLSIAAAHRSTHRQLRDQIASLDPNDTSGLGELEKLEAQLRQPSGKTSEERHAWGTSILQQIEAATSRRQLPRATLIPLLDVKSTILAMQARTPEQLDAACALLDELSALSPENAAWYAQRKTDILRHKERMQKETGRETLRSGSQEP